MRDCKMIFAGHDREVTFLCERCAVGEPTAIRIAGRSQIASARSKKIQLEKQPGVCVTCGGSRRIAGKCCHECGGSGVCPECNGDYSCRWSKLPNTAQRSVLSRLDHGEDLLVGYQAVRGLFREW